ncbi:MAG: hypothetical protein WC261_02840 [Synergistaceae bacterium]|jgi:hypothetical protein
MFYDLRDKLATGRLMSGIIKASEYVPGAVLGGFMGSTVGSVGGGVLGSAVGALRDDLTWREGLVRGMVGGGIGGGLAGAAILSPAGKKAMEFARLGRSRALSNIDAAAVKRAAETKAKQLLSKPPWYVTPRKAAPFYLGGLGAGAVGSVLPFTDARAASYARSPYLDKRAFNWTSPIALTYGGLGAITGLGAGYDPYGVKPYDYAKGLGGAALGGALGYGAGHLQKALISDVADSWANPWGGGAYPVRNR